MSAFQQFILLWCAHFTYNNVCTVSPHWNRSEFSSLVKANVPILWMDPNLFTHPSINRHLCCFHLWAVMNCASVIGGCQYLPQSLLLIVLGFYPKVEFLEHKINSCQTLKKSSRCLLTLLSLFYLIETCYDLGLRAYKFWFCFRFNIVRNLGPRKTLMEPQPLGAAAHLLTELHATNTLKLRKGAQRAGALLLIIILSTAG